MELMLVKHRDAPKLNRPVMIEGLPGVGNVGKLAGEHLVEELKAVHFADIYSKHFPPQVMVDDEGLAQMVSNKLYYHKREKPGKGMPGWGDRDILLLVGDFQGITPDGQYDICYEVMKLASDMGVEKVFTMGGYGLGRMVDEPRVLGAASSIDILEEMKDQDIVFGGGEQPGSGIVGASGLLLGMAPLFSMEGICFMGETSGYFVDPKSSEAVLRVMSSILGLDIDLSALETRAREIEAITAKLQDMDMPDEEQESDDTLRYIG